MSPSIVGDGSVYTCRHLMRVQRPAECVFCHRDELAVEVASLRNDLTACQLERERLRAALKRYGRHTVSCPATGIFAPPEGAPYCTCGFEAITAVPQPREHGA